MDVDPKTWCLDVRQVTAAITGKTRGVMPVHLYGRVANMEAILSIAEAHGLVVVEDAAEALGAEFRGAHVGTLSDAGTFSFFGNKLITTGEGGIACFRSGKVAERARLLRDHGMDPDRRYWHLGLVTTTV